MRNKSISKLVSVVITTRNRPGLLKLSIESVLNQTYKLIETIVVDDCSSIDTIEYIKSYLDKIKFIRHDQRLGTGAARMSGANIANGNYIAFIDDDDTWTENKIEKQFKVAEKSNSNCAVITCGAIIYKENLVNYSYPTLEGLIREGIFESGFKTIPSNHFFKKSIFDKIGGYDINFQTHEEHDIWMKLAKHNYETKCINEPLVIINESIRDRKMTKTISRLHSFEKFYRKWRNYVYMWYGVNQGKKILNKYMIYIYMMNASLLEEINKRVEARLFSIKTLKYLSLKTISIGNIKVLYRIFYYCLPVWVTNIYKSIKS